MSHGSFTQKTFVNDSVIVPIDADNLNELERVAKLTDEELAFSKTIRFRDLKNKFYLDNCKLIEDFEDYTSFTAAASTTLDEDTSPLCGNSSTKIIENDNTASWVGAYKTISSIDLTLFNSGKASTTSDFIALLFQISDHTKFFTFTMKLGSDNSNNYSYTVYPITNGHFDDDSWFTLSAKKSDFTSNGTPPGWDNITYIRIDLYSEANAQNEFITCEKMMLYRADADNPDNYNPFQLYDGSSFYNLFDIESYGFLAFDNKVKDIVLLDSDYQNIVGNERSIKLYDCIQFASKFELNTRYQSNSPSITWFKDTSNNFELRVNGGNLELDIYENGSNTTLQVALTNTLVYGQRIQICFEKNSTFVKGYLLVDGEKYKSLEWLMTHNQEEEGSLYIGHYANGGLGIFTDFQIGNVRNYFDSWDTPLIILKKTTQDYTTQTTPQPDADLWTYLPPSSAFEIHVQCIVSAASATPDFKISFTSTGITALNKDGRSLISSSSGTTSSADISTQLSNYAYSTNVSVGAISGQEIVHNEFLIIKTGNSGGKIQLNWSQVTSSSDYIRLHAGSSIKITKCKFA